MLRDPHFITLCIPTLSNLKTGLWAFCKMGILCILKKSKTLGDDVNDIILIYPACQTRGLSYKHQTGSSWQQMEANLLVMPVIALFLEILVMCRFNERLSKMCKEKAYIDMILLIERSLRKKYSPLNNLLYVQSSNREICSKTAVFRIQKQPLTQLIKHFDFT